MGQKVSHEDNQENKAETLVICEVFSQGVVHASQRLKDCLGFVDPQSKFQPAANTLSGIFLVSFIRFCMEKGVEECVTISKLTKQHSSPCWGGLDLGSGADKQIKLQVAVQALQLAELFHSKGGLAETVGDCCQEATLAGEHYRNRSRCEM
ncbi:PREDICTED: rab15 effector protein [Calidris pugnax]|uniref:rab15 effector protein n=1 Tax=Calidris pugnax TaxID=198806 RepID=UPI00071CFE74|nr:PREDICTED: rab15 effector protein [Calidris pugnax]